MSKLHDSPQPRASGDEWQAFGKKTIRERKYEDAFGGTIEHEPNPHKPTKEEIKRVRTVLALGAMHPARTIPRCRFRDHRKALKLDRELGHTPEEIKAKHGGTHTKNGHVCSLCRCSHAAGEKSRGWWYWPPNNAEGLGEVGHLGVGPCFVHSPMGRLKAGDLIKNYVKTVSMEILAMKEEGLAPDANRGWLVETRERVKESEERLSAKTASAAIFKLADETITRLRKHQQDPQGQGFMERLGEMFGFDPEELGQEEQQELMEIFSCCPLTEMASGKHVPMSDKTSIELQEKLIKSMGRQAKDTFDMHEDDFFHKDVVRVAFGRFLSAVEAIYGKKGDGDDWSQLIVEAKEIGRTLDQ